VQGLVTGRSKGETLSSPPFLWSSGADVVIVPRRQIAQDDAVTAVGTPQRRSLRFGDQRLLFCHTFVMTRRDSGCFAFIKVGDSS
jgi:hypothetical protein